jgi:NAD(P)-dependent dehydrogenase (short-subunit alcohol dehydrogenase family)
MFVVFGSSGYLGNNILQTLQSIDSNSFGISRNISDSNSKVLNSAKDIENWKINPKSIDGIVWAQGSNLNDSINNFREENIFNLFEANVLYILKTLDILLKNDLIKSRAKIVILSSVWQNISRPNKLSYSISKSSIDGLVKSLAIDLRHLLIQVNAILPGVVDSPMTRSNLNESEINKIIDETPMGSLINSQMVSEVCKWLLSKNSDGINGQSITLDGAWSLAKYL